MCHVSVLTDLQQSTCSMDTADREQVCIGDSYTRGASFSLVMCHSIYVENGYTFIHSLASSLVTHVKTNVFKYNSPTLNLCFMKVMVFSIGLK